MDELYVGKELHDKLAPFFNKPEKKLDPQAEAIELTNIPEATKRLIAAEYMRLRRLHPNWKLSKTARKAGEKYSVKFEFE